MISIAFPLRVRVNIQSVVDFFVCFNFQKVEILFNFNSERMLRVYFMIQELC